MDNKWTDFLPLYLTGNSDSLSFVRLANCTHNLDVCPLCNVLVMVFPLRDPPPSPKTCAYVVVQFYPWFNLCFPLFLCMVMYSNGYKTKDSKN